MNGGSWHCTEGRDQDDTQEKEVQKHNMVVWEGLTIAEKRSENQKRKRKIYPFKCRVKNNSKER